jgi:HEPN domain-containing protein
MAEKHPSVDAVCFHSQQCAEKYLKAFLQEKEIRFERTHVLGSLMSLCISADKEFKKIATDLDNLEGYGIAIRYPGATATKELAQQAFESTSRVRKFMRKKLRIQK